MKKILTPIWQMRKLGSKEAVNASPGLTYLCLSLVQTPVDRTALYSPQGLCNSGAQSPQRALLSGASGNQSFLTGLGVSRQSSTCTEFPESTSSINRKGCVGRREESPLRRWSN